MERNGTGRNLEFSKINRKKWNWKKPGNLKNRWKEMELEGTWKSQYQMEGDGTRRKLEILKIDGKKWNWKEPGILNIRWKEMELEGSWKS